MKATHHPSLACLWLCCTCLLFANANAVVLFDTSPYSEPKARETPPSPPANRVLDISGGYNSDKKSKAMLTLDGNSDSVRLEAPDLKISHSGMAVLMESTSLLTAPDVTSPTVAATAQRNFSQPFTEARSQASGDLALWLALIPLAGITCFAGYGIWRHSQLPRSVHRPAPPADRDGDW